MEIRGGAQTVNALESVDFFRSDAALRERCPVHRERHHDVMVVTGYDEAVEMFHDSERFSSCNSVSGPFPGFPVPLEGDDLSELIDRTSDIRISKGRHGPAEDRRYRYLPTFVVRGLAQLNLEFTR